MEMREQATELNQVVATTPNEAAGTTEVSEAISETASQSTAEAAPGAQLRLTLDEVVEAARALATKDPADISGDELRRLRQQFNTLHNPSDQPSASDADSTSEPPVAGNEEAVTGSATFVYPDALTIEFHGLLDAARERKNAWVAAQETLRAENLEKKNAIIAELIALAEDTDNVNRTFPRYRELVEQFTTIGEVPQSEDTALWKRFSSAREQYSDNLKINKELRDYDFKKNLEAKEAIIAEAESLVALDDLIEAFNRLQGLHEQWRRLGPVAKELRESVWDRFKTHSTEIRRRYQEHFEARKAREQANEQAKTALCETLEALDTNTLTSQNAWEQATEKVKEIQAQWKQLGYAARKANNALFARYRACCDKFFEEKARYYRESREAMANNLALRKAIVERAEALKDSTDWREATEQFVAMQKEWKTIGTVARRQGEELWKRFIGACDYFFDRKKQQGSDERNRQTDNLKAKIEVIEAVEAVADDSTREQLLEALKSAQQRWQAIGHVPFKDKDKVYDRYHAALDRVRQLLDQQRTTQRRRRDEAAVAEIEGDQNKLFRERERLLRAAEAKRAEIRTYENNLGFLSSKSKSGDSMLRDFQNRIERNKADLEGLLEKIRLIDSKLS